MLTVRIEKVQFQTCARTPILWPVFAPCYATPNHATERHAMPCHADHHHKHHPPTTAAVDISNSKLAHVSRVDFPFSQIFKTMPCNHEDRPLLIKRGHWQYT
jgi:hypothetical protein